MEGSGGHRMPPGEIHPALLLERFGSTRLYRSIVLFDRVDSTNAAALKAAARGAGEGSLFLADDQWSGRGRGSRIWQATRGKSLVFSLIARPTRDPAGLTSLLAISAARAIARAAGSASVKWPNDIYIGGRKVSGILAESKGGAVVLGMGINVNESRSDFPAALRDTATSLSIETGRQHERADLLVSVLEQFDRAYDEWARSGLGPFLAELEAMLIYRGERVCLERGRERITGVVRGLTAEGYLRLEVGGEEREFSAGDLSLRGWEG